MLPSKRAARPRKRCRGPSAQPSPCTTTNAAKAGRSPKSLGDRWGVEPEHAWGRLHRGATGATIESSRGRWDLYYPAFAAAVRGEGPVPVDPADTLRAMAVLDAARVSARTGTSVTL